ncbi:MAG: zinc ribbon domain-containing protein [Candidatus Hermodarchaeota archaeon]
MAQKVAKFCHSCGNGVSPDSAYCEACGTKLTVTPASYTAPPTPSYRTEGGDYKGYITLIGVLDIIFGLPALLIGTLLVLVDVALFGLIRSGRISVSNIVSHIDLPNPALLYFGAAIVLIVGIAFLILGLISIGSGARLLQHKNCARIVSMILGVLVLFSFPLGTLYGLFKLYVLSRPEVESLFKGCSIKGKAPKYCFTTA